MHHIENFWRGDYTRFFWETKSRIIINSIYYGLNTFLIFILTFVYFLIKIKILLNQNIKNL